MPTPQAQHAVDLRERAADAASLRHVLAPRSVAVVGASDRPGGLPTVDAKIRVAPVGADRDLRHDPLLCRLR